MTDPSRDFNACEYFFLLSFTAHVLCAAMEVLDMESFTDVPTKIPTGSQLSNLSCAEKRASIESVCLEIVDKFVDIEFPTQKCKPNENTDGVREYAKEVLTLGSFYSEFQDSIREGDGSRDARCWKYLMLYCR